MKKPENTNDAYNHGYSSHNEGMCPFRNTGVDDIELYSSWMDGFNQRKEDSLE